MTERNLMVPVAIANLIDVEGMKGQAESFLRATTIIKNNEIVEIEWKNVFKALLNGAKPEDVVQLKIKLITGKEVSEELGEEL